MTLAEERAEFRAAHPEKTFTHGSSLWRYLTGGSAGPPIVILTGALGIADFGFQVYQALEPTCRFVAPDYPDTDQPDAIVGGLVAILDRERIDRAVVHGGSFGGLIAQRFAERAPARVAGLVLSHTGPVAAAGAPGWLLGLLGLLPERWVVDRLTSRLRGLTRGVDPAWLPLLDEALAGMGWQRMMTRLRLAAGLARASGFGPRWAGPTLIIESDDDPAVRPAARAALRAEYPGAAHHRYSGTGHVAAMLDPKGYAELIGTFAAGLAA